MLISSDVFQDKCSTICFITDGQLEPGSESNVKLLVVAYCVLDRERLADDKL